MSEAETHDAMRALALKLINAAATRDVHELNEIFDQRAVIWHNTDDRAISMAENLPISASFAARVPRYGYEDIKVTPFEGGFIQQHRWTGTSTEGDEFNCSACAIAHVRDGKIVRIEEYFDSAPLIRLGIRAWLPKDE